MSTSKKDANKNAKLEIQAEKTKDDQDLAAPGGDAQAKEGSSSQEGAAAKAKPIKKKACKSSKATAEKKTETADKKAEAAGKQKPEETSGEVHEPADKYCGAGARDHCRCQEGEPKPLSQYTTKEVGEEGERIAKEYLQRRGYGIVECNWTCPAGEIDIIAYDPEHDQQVLVEVKTRVDRHKDYSIPELAVDHAKRQKYRKLALIYLSEHLDVENIRFDIIAINLLDNRIAKLRHLLGAFSWD